MKINTGISAVWFSIAGGWKGKPPINPQYLSATGWRLRNFRRLQSRWTVQSIAAPIWGDFSVSEATEALCLLGFRQKSNLTLNPGAVKVLPYFGFVFWQEPEREAAIRREFPRRRHELNRKTCLRQDFFRPDCRGGRVKQDDSVGHPFAILSTAPTTVSISANVVKGPGARRTVPCGKLPILRCAAGAQCSPTLQRMPYSSSSR